MVYISFVVGSRNDDYGGNQRHRMQVFLNALVYFWEKCNLDSELVIVEWNPPPNTPGLSQVLHRPEGCDPRSVRIVEVPLELHNRLPNSDLLPIFQEIAKNVGVRRSKGEFIIATDPDMLYSEELMTFLAAKSLKRDSFYRVDRYDVDETVPLDMKVEEQLDFCLKHTTKVNVQGLTIKLHMPPVGLGRMVYDLQKWHHRSFGSVRTPVDILHTNASGSFTLLSRDQWWKLRGYPELPTIGHIDSYLISMAASAGIQQIVLPDKMRIFHQEHARAIDWRDLRAALRPLTPYEQWVADSVAMLRRKEPRIFNGTDWGLGNEKLEERSLQ